MFLDTLKETLKFIGVSDVKMEEGSLRCDVNINMTDEETGAKTRITEIKNLNSFRAAVKAMEYEQKRHRDLLAAGEEGVKETRRWDDVTNTTSVMRKKEEGNDYRFSVEGDLPVTVIDPETIETLRTEMPMLPRQKKEQYVAEYGLEPYDAGILSQNMALSDYFERTVALTKKPQLTSNWMLSDLLRRINEAEMEADELALSAENFAKLILLADGGKINNNTAKKVLREIFETDEDPEALVVSRGLIQITDTSELEAVVDEVLAANPKSIEDIKNGKDRALGFLVGQCMKKTKGKGNPQEFNKMIAEKIKTL
jgi:aspartyl-tRNA(Asn)/glutamyl-tRNA(Gln) amidotransferase subunit B